MHDVTTYILGGTALGAVMALLATVWGHAKGMWVWVSGLILQRIMVSSGGADPAQSWLWNTCTAAPTSIRNYKCMNYVGFIFSMGKKPWVTVVFESIGPNTRLFWHGCRPIFVRFSEASSRSGGQRGAEPASGGEGNGQLELVFFKNKWFGFDPDTLMTWIVNRNDDQQSAYLTKTGAKNVRFRVIEFYGRGSQEREQGGVREGRSHPRASVQRSLDMELTKGGKDRIVNYDVDDFHDPSPPDTNLNKMWLSPLVKEAVEEANRWHKAQDWYAERGIPWRRGWLEYGDPGTGKTSLAVAVAQHLDMPIFRFDLGSMSNDEFQQYWEQASQEAPAMILFEDIDRVFKKSDNVQQHTSFQKPLTFDAILNAICGAKAANGIFLVVTTNYIDEVDSALKRPGRLDRIIKLEVPDEEGRVMIARRILRDFSEDEIKKAANDYRGTTGAVFQEYCISLAMSRWDTADAKPLKENSNGNLG